MTQGRKSFGCDTRRRAQVSVTVLLPSAVVAAEDTLTYLRQGAG